MEIVNEIERIGIRVPEVITAGTPTLPSSLSFAGFRNAGFVHRVSPGTVVYCDASSMAQLSAEYGYRPAVLVLTSRGEPSTRRDCHLRRGDTRRCRRIRECPLVLWRAIRS